MPKGYVYVRYSTAEQSSGDSLNRQLRLAHQFAKARPDLNIEVVDAPVFLDSGVSSFLGGNLAPDKGLGKFLKAVDTGEIAAGSVLLVESLDRLSRQELIHAQRVFLDIINRQIVIATTSPTESHVYNGQSGLIDLIIMLTRMERAHEESALKSSRVKEAWKQKREKAKANNIITRVCPQWLTVSDDGKTFIVNEERANVVRDIFKMAETMGYQLIARNLNEAGVKEFSERSNGWQSSRIVKILRNPAVIGTYQPRAIEHVRTDEGYVRRTNPQGEPIEGYYPAIVAPEDFHRVQTIVQSRTSGASGRKGKRVSNLFSGVATCEACGSNMVMVQKGTVEKSSFLVCTVARRGSPKCKYHAWPYEALERSFLTYCQNIDLSELVPTDEDESSIKDISKKVDSLTGERAELERVLGNLQESVISNGGVMPAATQNYMLKSERRIEAIDAELSAKKKELKEAIIARKERRDFSSMFRSLLEELGSASGPELMKIRSGIHRAVRSSVLKMELGVVSEPLSKSMREVLGEETPALTRKCQILFRSGVIKFLYFSGRRLVCIMHRTPDNPTPSIERVPLEEETDGRKTRPRALDGKWLPMKKSQTTDQKKNGRVALADTSAIEKAPKKATRRRAKLVAPEV